MAVGRCEIIVRQRRPTTIVVCVYFLDNIVRLALQPLSPVSATLLRKFCCTSRRQLCVELSISVIFNVLGYAAGAMLQ
jgi:hypothetical protein